MLNATKSCRVRMVSTTPTMMQINHAGKNDPRMLTDGAKRQPETRRAMARRDSVRARGIERPRNRRAAERRVVCRPGTWSAGPRCRHFGKCDDAFPAMGQQRAGVRVRMDCHRAAGLRELFVRDEAMPGLHGGTAFAIR